MSTHGSPSDAALRLKQLLREANIKSHRLDSVTHGITFIGRSREWQISARLTIDWLHVSASVFTVPSEPGLRAQLLEWAMGANRILPLVKFGVADGVVVLEVDYRAEHVDAAALANIVSLVYTIAEEQYPKAFRIVSGDQRLEALEASLLTAAPR